MNYTYKKLGLIFVFLLFLAPTFAIAQNNLTVSAPNSEKFTAAILNEDKHSPFDVASYNLYCKVSNFIFNKNQKCYIFSEKTNKTEEINTIAVDFSSSSPKTTANASSAAPVLLTPTKQYFTDVSGATNQQKSIADLEGEIKRLAEIVNNLPKGSLATQEVVIKYVQGPKGEKGDAGIDGKDGRDGVDGANGSSGSTTIINSGFTGFSGASASFTNNIIANLVASGVSNITTAIVNTLSSENATFTNATTTNGYITTLNGATANFSGDVTINGNTFLNGNIVSSSTFSVSTSSAQNLVFVNASGTNALIGNSTTTNATSTNLFANIFNAVAGTISDLLFNNATGTNLNLANLNTGNISATGTANLNNITGATLDYANATTTNSTSTNSFITNLNTTNLTSSTSTINNLNVQNETVNSSTSTNATSTNFFANIINGLTSFIASLTTNTINTTDINATGTATINNLAATNSTSTNSTSTNLFANNLTGSNGTFGTFSATNTSGTSTIASGQGFAVGTGASSFNILGSNGFVGLGTTSPQSNLEIYNNPGASLRVTGGTNALSALSFYENSTVKGNLVWRNNTGQNALQLINFASGPIQLFTNTVERMVIDSAGNVGIGTTTPGAKLSVQGSANISGDINLANLNATGTITTIGNVSTNSTSTNATSTNFFASVFNAASSFISNLLFTNATGTNLNLANLNTGNISATGTATINNLTATNSTVVNSTSTNSTSTTNFATNSVTTNATSTNFFSSVLNSLTGFIASLTTNTINTTNIAATGTATINNLTAVNGSISNGTFGTFSATNTSGTSTIAQGQGFSLGTGSAQFVVQGGTGKIGIGTSTPTSALSLGNGVIDANIYIANNNASNRIFWSRTDGSQVTGIGSDGFSQMTFIGNNAERMRIDGAGNVGIGTTTPGNKLSVQGSANISGDLNLANINATGTITSTGVGSFGRIATTLGSGTSTIAEGQGFVVGSNRFVVQQTTGFVGLGGGASNPAALLHLSSAFSTPYWGNNGVQLRIAGNTLTDNTSSGAVSSISNNSISSSNLNATNPTTYANANSFTINGAPTPNANVTITNSTALNIAAATLTGVTNGYGMRVAASTGATNNYAAIFTGGNVGIGTATSPGARLQLSGNISQGAQGTSGLNLRVDGGTFTDTSSAGTVTNSAVNAFGIPTLAASSATTYTNAYNTFIAGAPTSGTNVTIGNSYALHVAANTLTNTTNGYGLMVNTPTGATNNYSAAFIGGNVGVGTTSPQDKLTVSGSSAAAASIRLENTATGNTFRLVPGVIGSSNNGFSIYDNVAAATRFIISSNGVVSINTAAPIATNGGLDVSSGGLGLIGGADNNTTTRTDATTKFFRFGAAHYTNSEEPVAIAHVNANSTGNDVMFGGGTSIMNAATSLNFYTAGNNTTVTGIQRMIINGAGNVGIGTTTPTNPLTLPAGSTAVPALSLGDTGTGFSRPSLNALAINVAGTLNWTFFSGSLQSTTVGGLSLLTGTPSLTSPTVILNRNDTATGIGGAQGTLSFITGGASRLFVDTTGNVGIGTTTPWRTFSVSGTVAMSGLNTVTGASQSALCLATSTGEVLVNTNTQTCTVSSQRFKHDIEDLSYDDNKTGLEKVLSLRPRQYIYNGTSDQRIGFIAEEMQQVDPRLIFYENDGVTVRGVRYEEVTSLLAKSIQDLNYKLEGIRASSTEANYNVGNTDMDLNGHMITNVASIASANGSWSISASGRIVAQEICLGSTCINENALQQLMYNAGMNPQSNSGMANNSDSNGTTTPESNSTTTPETVSDTSTTTDTTTGEPSAAPQDTSTTTPEIIEPVPVIEPEPMPEPTPASETQPEAVVVAEDEPTL